jgi:hypothetical protein
VVFVINSVLCYQYFMYFRLQLCVVWASFFYFTRVVKVVVVDSRTIPTTPVASLCIRNENENVDENANDSTQ